MPSELAPLWPLDPAITFLNHGSFGSCPRAVLEAQRGWRDRMEAQPIQFLARDLGGLLANARAALGEFVGADADDLAFVANATGAINAVVRSLRFEPGDELLTDDHEYNAVLNVARHVAVPLLERFGLPADTSYDLLLCALYYRTFIADRSQDERLLAEAQAAFAASHPFAYLQSGQRPAPPSDVPPPLAQQEMVGTGFGNEARTKL